MTSTWRTPRAPTRQLATKPRRSRSGVSLIDSEGPQAAEARVRLGELTAEPAKQG